MKELPPVDLARSAGSFSMASPRLAVELDKLHAVEDHANKQASLRRPSFLLEGAESLGQRPSSFSSNTRPILPPLPSSPRLGKARRASATYAYPLPTNAAEAVAFALSQQMAGAGSGSASPRDRESLRSQEGDSSPRALVPTPLSTSPASNSLPPVLLKGKSRRSSLSIMYKSLGIEEAAADSKLLNEIRALDRDYGIGADGNTLALESLNDHLKKISTKHIP